MAPPTIQSAHDWLSTQRNSMVADLIELANVNSGSSNLAGLRQVACKIENWIDFRSTSFAAIGLPTRRSLGDRGETVEHATGDLLAWHFQPNATRRILLGIHYDTVYGVDDPLQRCSWRSTSQLAGPGVADAKGGIIVMRYALQAVQRFELAQNFGWTVFLNPDEEIGSPSSAAYLREIAPHYEAGLLFEPAFPDGSLVCQRKGSGNFTILSRGRSAHVGRNIERGRNAITHLAKLVARLDALRTVDNDLTINVGHFVGGGAVNVVPDTAIVRINLRAATPESQMWAEQQLNSLVDQFNQQDGLSCELHGGFHAPAKLIDQSMSRLMSLTETAAQRLGQEIHWTKTGGVSDGNKLAAAGLANVDTLGPIGDCLHSSDEWVSVDSLVSRASLVVQLLHEMSIQPPVA